MKIGEKFRLLREQKNLTQAEACGNILSRSRLSTFEQGKGDISYKKLINLLERINVSMLEFEQYMYDSENVTQAEFYADVHNAKQENNLTWLKLLEEEQSELYKETNNQRFLFNNIIARQVRFLLLDAPYESQKINQIYCYLSNLNHWNKYDVNLFGNTVFCMNYSKVRDLCFSMLNFLQRDSTRIYRRNDAVLLVLNILYTCLESGELSDAKVFIQKAYQLIDPSYDYYEQTKLLFLDGIRLILGDKVSQGSAQAKKAIGVMETLKDYKNANRYTKYLDKILEKASEN